MENASFDTWTSIFVIGAVQGAFMGLLVALRKGNPLYRRLLASILFLFAVTLGVYVLYWTDYIHQYRHFWGSYFYMDLAFGPLFYLYVSKVLKQEKRLKTADGLHFLPFVVQLLISSPFMFSSLSGKAAMLEEKVFPLTTYTGIGYWIMIVFRCVQLLVYLGAMLYLWYQYKSQIKLFKMEENLRVSGWLKVCICMFGGFVLAYLSYYVMVGFYTYYLPYDYAISFSMMAFIYVFAYMGFIQPKVFSGYVSEWKSPKYERSALHPKAAQAYASQLRQWMESEQPYLNDQFKLKDLASQLGISSHHVSEVLNTVIGLSFSDFVNQYRVQTARTLIEDPKYADTYLIEIAYDSGFNNKTSFHTAFKKWTGMTPGGYRVSVKRDSVGEQI